MILRFKKGIKKPSTLSCIRPDGSTTRTKLDPAIETHDLAHFVIETELGFKEAFYGLLAKGFSIEDFELPRQQRPEALIPANLPPQALQAEHMVNLLQISFLNTDDFDFIPELRKILEENELSFPEALDDTHLKNIFKRFQDLLGRWNTLEDGESLELVFE